MTDATAVEIALGLVSKQNIEEHNAMRFRLAVLEGEMDELRREVEQLRHRTPDELAGYNITEPPPPVA